MNGRLRFFKELIDANKRSDDQLGEPLPHAGCRIRSVVVMSARRHGAVLDLCSELEKMTTTIRAKRKPLLIEFMDSAGCASGLSGATSRNAFKT